MTGAPLPIAREYAMALADYLAGAGEAALHRAYELGRRAVSEGLSLLDMVSLHHNTLQSLLEGRSRAAWAPLFESAQTYLAETLSPFEMAHRELREAIETWRGLNQVLEDSARQIAHALHDDAGQLLVSVHLALSALGKEHPALQGRMKEVRGLLDEVEHRLRRLSHELRPPALDALGLLPAVEFLAQGVSERTGIAIDVEGSREGRLPAPWRRPSIGSSRRR